MAEAILVHLDPIHQAVVLHTQALRRLAHQLLLPAFLPANFSPRVLLRQLMRQEIRQDYLVLLAQLVLVVHLALGSL